VTPVEQSISTNEAVVLIDILEAALHASKSEWIFLRELRVGTGHRNNVTPTMGAQRLDAFALNYLPHLGMKRVCYEVKTSRGNLRSELKRPLKRRIGMRYSNEFYFVTPAGLFEASEVPVDLRAYRSRARDCRRVEVAYQEAGGLLQFRPGFWRVLHGRSTGPRAAQGSN
jgi:hypothetical protein